LKRCGQAKYFLAAMIRVKDEARFLPEWLAYHLNIGVEHVFIYDNNSSDNTEAIIAPFVAKGFATYTRWPKTPASPSCHLDFLARFGCEAEWVAFFDADEFLFERTPGLLLDLLRRSLDEPAIAFNWRYFGSSGYELIPDGLVIENFNRANANLDHHVKVVARPRAIHRYRNSHNFYYRGSRLARTPNGRWVPGSFSEPNNDLPFVLRHYVYRSKADYERKTARGSVDSRGAVDNARHASRTNLEFGKHNHVIIVASPRVLHATRALLEGLGYDEQLYNTSSQA
jgi:Glycosyltransferase family 92